MSVKKQTKTSKNPATKSNDKNPYKGKGLLLPNRLIREDGYIPVVAKHPEIFEYINNFKNNKKYLLLTEGTKEEHITIMEYVLEELPNRKLMRPDKQLKDGEYILREDKEVFCFNKDNSKLKLEVYDRVTNHKGFCEALLNDIYCFLRSKSEKDDFYRYSSGMSKDFKHEVTKADCEIYREIDILEGTLLDDISDTLKEYRGKNESVDRICEHFSFWLSLTVNRRRFKVLSLIDISSNNNEFWLGYTTELMKKFSSDKPDLILATLKEGESVKELPEPFTNLFKIISLGGEEAVVEPVKEVAEPGVGLEGKQPVPSKYNWSDIEIVFVNNENIEIKVGGTKDKKHYSEMGFEDKRKGEPDRAWKRLMLFALQAGTITSDFNNNILKKNDDYYVKLKDIESINEKLCTFFKVINEKPIPTYDRKLKCYKINLKYIGLTDNLRRYIESILITKSQKDDEDISDEEFIQQARDNSYSSSPFSDKLEDDPLYQDDDQNHTSH